MRVPFKKATYLRNDMGFMGNIGLFIKTGLTVAFLFVLYAMGPCGWMIGATLLLYVTNKERSYAY